MDRNALNLISTWFYDDRMWYVTPIHCSGYKPRKSAQLLGEGSASSHNYSTWGFSYLSWKKRFDYGVVRRAQQLAPLWFAVQLKGQNTSGRLLSYLGLRSGISPAQYQSHKLRRRPKSALWCLPKKKGHRDPWAKLPSSPLFLCRRWNIGCSTSMFANDGLHVGHVLPGLRSEPSAFPTVWGPWCPQSSLQATRQ